MGFYSDRIVPRIIERTLNTGEAHGYRRLATSGFRGTVVEVGFGSGLNVAHYPTTVERVYALEPSGAARQLAEPRIAESRVPVELVGLDGQHLPLDDGAPTPSSPPGRCAPSPTSTPPWPRCAVSCDPAVTCTSSNTACTPTRRSRPGSTASRRSRSASSTAATSTARWTNSSPPPASPSTSSTNHQMRAPRTFGYLYQGRATPAP